MVARVIHKLKADSIPGYFQPVAEGRASLARRGGSLARVTARGGAPGTGGGHRRPGRDLARMAALFEEELAGAQRPISRCCSEYAIAAARAGKHRFFGLPVVLLDVDPRGAAPGIRGSRSARMLRQCSPAAWRVIERTLQCRSVCWVVRPLALILLSPDNRTPGSHPGSHPPIPVRGNRRPDGEPDAAWTISRPRASR